MLAVSRFDGPLARHRPCLSQGFRYPARKAFKSQISCLSNEEEGKAVAPLRADIKVKINMASSLGKLDLSDCDLDVVPLEVFELTNLTELSLAGNNLLHIPDGIGNLKNLSKLQLSGNRLSSLPESICQLEFLEGLWLHGNLLEHLPQDIGSLMQLKQLAVAGNRLTKLPDSIGLLNSLVELVAAGNKLEEVPKSIGVLSECRILDLHGNHLASIPPTIGMMDSLEELWLQGNPRLSTLPAELGQCKSLKKLSAADCGLQGSLAAELGSINELQDLSLYGNQLHEVPLDVLDAPKLKKLWLERNPLHLENIKQLMARVKSGSMSLGLDATQLENAGIHEEDPAATDLRNIIKSQILDNDQGYFKLERHMGAHSSAGERSNVLVVAFGSAPGTPNWGGALRRVREDFDRDSHADINYDVLYVVDPERSWYHGGDDRFHEYDEVIAATAKGYQSTLFIGDSMGATACLLFAKHADVVHAFCPQIDLSKSSIRPGEDATWEQVLKERVMKGIDACQGSINVHVGNWHHDIQQVNMIPTSVEHTHVKIYGVDSHRLAIALDRSGKLLNILASSLLGFYGRMSQESALRISNYL
jgi:Leucine-rich repeat (LRR) protein